MYNKNLINFDPYIYRLIPLLLLYERQINANINEFCCFISSINIIFDRASLNVLNSNEVGIVRKKKTLRNIKTTKAIIIFG